MTIIYCASRAELLLIQRALAIQVEHLVLSQGGAGGAEQEQGAEENAAFHTGSVGVFLQGEEDIGVILNAEEDAVVPAEARLPDIAALVVFLGV